MRASAQYPFQVSSDNGQFVVEVDQIQNDFIDLTVLKQEKSIRTIQWTARLPAPRAPHQTRPMITDDGESVVVENDSINDSFALAFLRRNGLKQLYSLRKMMSQFDQKNVGQSATGQSNDLDEFETSLWSDAGCVRLLDTPKAPRFFCLWFRSRNEWLAWDLNTGAPVKVTPQQGKRWHDEARARAISRVKADQASQFRKVVEQVEDKAKQLLNLPPKSSALGRSERTDLLDAYRYLVRRKVPEDRKWIEGLLTSQDFNVGVGQRFGVDATTLKWANLWSEKRTLGDRLLAEWDGVWPVGRRPPMGPSGLEGGGIYLGQVRGTLELPIPPTRTDGALWIYLIPTTWGTDEWKHNPPLLAIRANLADVLFRLPYRRTLPGFDDGSDDSADARLISFTFTGITPGKYRLKAVWDKQPPFASKDAKVGVADAGDYESALGAPIEVAAAEILEGLIVSCTNRVGRDLQIYSADERRIQDVKVGLKASDEQQSNTAKTLRGLPKSRGRLAVGFPFSAVRQNDNGGRSNLNKLTFGLRHISHGHEVVTEEDCLVAWFNERPVRRDDIGLSSLAEFQIIDEHGCKLSTHSSGEMNDERSSVSFCKLKVFPRRQPTFQLQILQENDVSVFLVTNVARREFPDWKADLEPYRKVVAGADVTFMFRGRSHFGGEGKESWSPEFHVNDGVQQSEDWEYEQLIFEDATGNKSPSLDALCRNEKVIKVSARLFRARDADFAPEETWCVRNLVMPEPGHAGELSLSNRLQGVTVLVCALSGTGETTYSNSVPIAATAQMSPEASPWPPAYAPRYGLRTPPGEINLPSVFVKRTSMEDFMSPMPTMFGRREIKPLTVVSRVPHVAVRIKGLTDQHRFFLKQSEDLTPNRFQFDRINSMLFPADRRPVEPLFLPLPKAVAGEKLELTFVVQKCRDVELFVKRPQAEESKQRR